MRIVLGYPPLPDTEHLGMPQTQQNRQFQWFTEPTHIYPVIPAYAATMLGDDGHEVWWIDGPTKGYGWQEYLGHLIRIQPDLIAWEVKTPIVQRVWPLVDEVKRRLPDCTVVLMGDHITALPDESMQNCAVDFCLTGGDFDFGLRGLVEAWWRSALASALVTPAT